jgi:beta-lactam-binding protein with PASTA domain
MRNPFAITTTVSNISLSSDRVGEAVFTVSNTSESRLRGRALIAADDANVESWLTLLGDAEREFESGSTEHYVVRIEAPPDAPSESYPFRLDMVGVANPDEEYSQGPTITFTTPPPAEVGPAFPWWIPVAAVVILLIAVVAIWRPWETQEVQIPDFAAAGLRAVDAEATVTALELVVGGRTPVPSDREQGIVTGSEPPAGARVDPGTRVDLLVSIGVGDETPTPTATQTPTEEPTPTFTPTATSTPTSTSTSTPTVATTPTPTSIPTVTPTPSFPIITCPEGQIPCDDRCIPEGMLCP